jgi:hypothetical protein
VSFSVSLWYSDFITTDLPSFPNTMFVRFTNCHCRLNTFTDVLKYHHFHVNVLMLLSFLDVGDSFHIPLPSRKKWKVLCSIFNLAVFSVIFPFYCYTVQLPKKVMKKDVVFSQSNHEIW